MKKFGFFSLGEIFIGNGMGKWGGENSLKTFGNMHHPRDSYFKINDNENYHFYNQRNISILQICLYPFMLDINVTNYT